MKNPKKKTILIGSLITFIVTLVIAALVFVLSYFSVKEPQAEDLMRSIVDGLICSGIFGLLIYLLSVLSEKGAFDILTYSIKLVWYNTFHRNIRNTALPKTYAEYKELKGNKPKSEIIFLLIGSLPCLVSGLIAMIPYYVIFR